MSSKRGRRCTHSYRNVYIPKYPAARPLEDSGPAGRMPEEQAGALAGWVAMRARGLGGLAGARYGWMAALATALSNPSTTRNSPEIAGSWSSGPNYASAGTADDVAELASFRHGRLGNSLNNLAERMQQGGNQPQGEKGALRRRGGAMADSGNMWWRTPPCPQSS